MKEAAIDMDEVVVIGYGTVARKDLTGSVATLSGKSIANIPMSNTVSALTGRMAGVNITTTDGAPDAEVQIRVRGGGSITQDNSPLYIVDGFPMDRISDISPNDIETIDILKDAASTAIYGARGRTEWLSLRQNPPRLVKRLSVIMAMLSIRRWRRNMTCWVRMNLSNCNMNC